MSTQFDMATSAIALFGVLTAKAKGEALPPNVAFGKDGQMTTNAAEALDGGAIATFGGHKGAGLSLCVELLAGALSGSAVLGQCESKKAARNWGHTFIAIQPDGLVDDFESKAASIIATVKASGSNIRIPGERSARTAAERLQAGSMPIPEKIWESICHTAENGLPK
jgi:delta1-piperideine-2-carboxylate reductase